MPRSAIAQHPGGQPAPQEVGFEVAEQNPRTSEGFLIPDLTDPVELAPGEVPFETFKGTASIARANVSWQFRVPEEFTRNGSVIIAHGLGAKQGAYSGLADYLASHGVATADYRAAHLQGRLAGLHPKHLLDASRLLYQAPWGVIRNIQERDDIDAPKDIFSIPGHSLGGRTAVKNAHQHPDTIDHVIAIDSIGLEDHHIFGLGSRLPNFFWRDFRSTLAGKELDIEDKARLVANGVLYFAENPLRSGGEIWSLSKSRIGDELAALRETETAGTAIVASPEDVLVHTDEKEEGKPHLMLRLPKLKDKILDHMGPVRYPEVYGRTIISVLNHLDEVSRPNQATAELQAA